MNAFGRKLTPDYKGRLIYTSVGASRNFCRCCGVPEDEIVALNIREWEPGDPESPYWGWEPADQPGTVQMVWPTYTQLAICFPYGVEEAQRAGRGRAVNLILTETSSEEAAKD